MVDELIINIKLLSYKSPQRYAVKRTLSAALNELRKQYPQAELEITEIKDFMEMQKYTSVLILPSLLINGQLVCIGRFPHKGETVEWLRTEIERLAQPAQKA